MRRRSFGIWMKCPKCGEEGQLIVKRNKKWEYFMIQHYHGLRAEKRAVYHYLGPTSRFPELLVVWQERKAKVRNLEENDSKALQTPSIPSEEEFLKFTRSLNSDEARKVLERWPKDRAMILRAFKLLEEYFRSSH